MSWRDVERLADTSGEHRALILLLGSTGLRLDEALGLEQRDVDRERGRILIGARQNRQPPWVLSVSEAALNLLPEGDGLLFPSENGRRMDPRWWRLNIFRPAAERLGLAGVRAHDLRHAVGTRDLHPIDAIERIAALQQFVKQCEHDEVAAVPVSLLAKYVFGDEG